MKVFLNKLLFIIKNSKQGKYGVIILAIGIFSPFTAISSDITFIEAIKTMIICFIVAVILFIVGHIKSASMNYSSEQKNKKLEKYIVKKPHLHLNSDETCYYQGEAELYVEKTAVVGYNNSRAGMSIKVAKGLTFHTGDGASKSIRGTVSERFKGTFFVTNKRIIMLSSQKGFDLPYKKLLSINADKNQGFQFFEGTKCHTVLTKDAKKIMKIFSLIEI